MTKAEFMKEMKADCGHDEKTVNDVLNSLRSVMLEGVANGEKIPIFMGAVACQKKIPARRRLNMATGEYYDCPESIGITVKFSDAFKKELKRRGF